MALVKQPVFDIQMDDLVELALQFVAKNIDEII
jgi:hypothetical protein